MKWVTNGKAVTEDEVKAQLLGELRAGETIVRWGAAYEGKWWNPLDWLRHLYVLCSLWNWVRKWNKLAKQAKRRKEKSCG